jgi:hypothetical protein
MKLRAALLISAIAALILTQAPQALSAHKTLKIFDGKTLTGWDGDPRFWSVKDGCITGETTASNPTQGNTFLIWRGGTVKDFEFKTKYRIVGGNSGIQYRSKEVSKWVIGGYQADFEAGDTWNGILYEERGRGILAPPGERTSVWSNGKPLKLASIGDPAAIKKAIKKEKWNTYRVTAEGFHFQHQINGVITSQMEDEDAARRVAEGLLALQLHAGPPMRVQFKDLKLTPL